MVYLEENKKKLPSEDTGNWRMKLFKSGPPALPIHMEYKYDHCMGILVKIP